MELSPTIRIADANDSLTLRAVPGGFELVGPKGEIVRGPENRPLAKHEAEEFLDHLENLGAQR
jgi:hypothetical protein